MPQHKRSEKLRTHSHVLVESTNMLFHVGLSRLPVSYYFVLCLLKGNITGFMFLCYPNLKYRKSGFNFGSRWKDSMLCVSRGILTCCFESCDLLLGNTHVSNCWVQPSVKIDTIVMNNAQDWALLHWSSIIRYYKRLQYHPLKMRRPLSNLLFL